MFECLLQHTQQFVDEMIIASFNDLSTQNIEYQMQCWSPIGYNTHQFNQFISITVKNTK